MSFIERDGRDLIREYLATADEVRGAVDETRREVYCFLNNAGLHVAAAKVAAEYGIDIDPYAKGKRL